MDNVEIINFKKSSHKKRSKKVCGNNNSKNKDKSTVHSFEEFSYKKKKAKKYSKLLRKAHKQLDW